MHRPKAMFHRAIMTSLVIGSLLLAFQGSYAQKDTNPPPSPSPTPSPEARFDSPFNGPRDPKGEEAKDFGKLMDLYDAMKDAESALEHAKRCKGDTQAAQKALDKATAEFDTALAEYLDGWSNNTYSGMAPPGVGGVKHVDQKKIESDKAYPADRKLVMDALAKQDKKKHPVGGCPESDTQKKETPPQPQPQPKPKAGDGGVLGDILGHVRIGVDVGGGHRDDRDKGGDKPKDTDKPKDSDRPPD